MRVIQFLPELNEGGVERGVVELNREYVKKGIKSFVVSNGGKLVEQIEKDGGKHVKFDVCSKNIFTVFSRALKLRKIIKEINPDILHVRSRVPAWLVYLANKSLGIKVVSSIHGLNSINCYSKIMTKGNVVICVSEIVRDYVFKGYKNLDKNKFHVIQRGVDLDKFNEKNLDNNFIEKFKLEYNLDNRFIVSSVGRITWLKDYETFIKSISLVKKDIPNVVGLIVGGAREDKKEYLESLKNLAKDLNIIDNIIFVGSQQKMTEIYFLSDILVNVSLKMGNVGRTVTESLAMNTPVIATSYEGLNNIVIDNVNGAIIETKNEEQLSEKIKLIKDSEYINLRNTIPKEFTLENMVKDNIKIYENLIKGK